VISKTRPYHSDAEWQPLAEQDFRACHRSHNCTYNSPEHYDALAFHCDCKMMAICYWTSHQPSCGHSEFTAYGLFTMECPPCLVSDFCTFSFPVHVLCKELEDKPGFTRKWERGCLHGVYVDYPPCTLAVLHWFKILALARQFHVVLLHGFITSV